MKKVLLLLIVAIFATHFTIAQDIVTTRPQRKAVVLEEYTGVKCPACPSGHAAAEAIVDDYPDKTFIINIHNGYYAIPEEGMPDFRTQFGSSLEGQTSLGGYPAGTINRHLFADLTEDGGTALYRGEWPEACERIFDETSIVNVGVSTSYNDVSREVIITVEAYYVEGLPFGLESNFLQVAILESGVVGYQSGQGDYYTHNHILRDLVTGQWGEEIENIEAGSLITRTYTYTVDEEFVAENCSVVAFITETKQEVITGAEVPLIDGLHNGEIEADFGRLFTNNSLEAGTEDQNTTFDLTLINGLNESQDVTLTLNHDAPEDWEVTFSVNEAIYTESNSLTLSPDDVKEIMINVTPGATVGVAHCELVLTSNSYPSESAKVAEVFVVSGVDNLIVNGSGTINDVSSAEFAETYKNTLSNAGCSSHGAIPGYAFEQAADLGLLDEVKNIYLNIGGTVPVLTIGQTSVLTSFIDNGGNVLIAGQDLGADIFGSHAESHSFPQILFYQNYIGCSYINDGNSGNNSIFSISDSVYSGLSDITLFDAYSGNFSPDVVKSYGDSEEILFYEDGAAGIKNYIGSSKIAYFAFGLEQIQNENDRNDLMDRTYRWFEGWEGSNVELNSFADIEVYPNPVSNYLKIRNFDNLSSFRILNVAGQEVLQGSDTDKIDVSKLTDGLYFIEMNNDNDFVRIKFTKN